jgi:hypothetical protein
VLKSLSRTAKAVDLTCHTGSVEFAIVRGQSAKHCEGKGARWESESQSVLREGAHGMIIYDHLSVVERVLQYKGTVWNDCAYHMFLYAWKLPCHRCLVCHATVPRKVLPMPLALKPSILPPCACSVSCVTVFFHNVTWAVHFQVRCAG